MWENIKCAKPPTSFRSAHCKHFSKHELCKKKRRTWQMKSGPSRLQVTQKGPPLCSDFWSFTALSCKQNPLTGMEICLVAPEPKTAACTVQEPHFSHLRFTFASTRFKKKLNPISSTPSVSPLLIHVFFDTTSSPRPGKPVPVWQAVGRKSHRSVWRPRFVLCRWRVRSRSTAPMLALQALLFHTIKVYDDLCTKQHVEDHSGLLQTFHVLFCCGIRHATLSHRQSLTLPMRHGMQVRQILTLQTPHHVFGDNLWRSFLSMHIDFSTPLSIGSDSSRPKASPWRAQGFKPTMHIPNDMNRWKVVVRMPPCASHVARTTSSSMGNSGMGTYRFKLWTWGNHFHFPGILWFQQLPARLCICVLVLEVQVLNDLKKEDFVLMKATQLEQRAMKLREIRSVTTLEVQVRLLQ